MKLYIDTTSREKITVGIDNEMYETRTKEKSSQRLLPFIDEVVRKSGKDMKDITEIKIATGPGSFTGLRVGVSVGNTLGWVLKIPVNGKKWEDDINYF